MRTNILSGPLTFPNSTSKEAIDLIQSLMQRDPSKRLGAGEKDASAIKEHPFFEGFNWAEINSKKCYLPKLL